MGQKLRALVIQAFCLFLSSVGVCAQNDLWDKYDRNGREAAERGHYDEAERSQMAAIKEAEKLGSKNLRLSHSLSELGVVYYEQGKYAKAEALYKRALGIEEELRGSEHTEVAKVLNNLAELYRIQASAL
jgi:tetratricopeptide (TPR) repeat protein